jgi:cyclic pyranopterin phosphate synthase
VKDLTHTDGSGRARMVDVGDKEATARRARASARVRLSPDAVAAVRDDTSRKGDVLAVARLAGIQAAKRTAELIPLCHPLRLDAIRVEAVLDEKAGEVRIEAESRARDRTGVEMEALTAAAVAGLTVYDMVKAVDREAELLEVRLEEKSGGRSGAWSRRSGG